METTIPIMPAGRRIFDVPASQASTLDTKVIPFMGSIERAFPAVFDNAMKYYSLVLFGTCNFRCKYCCYEGDKIDKKGRFPQTKEERLGNIKQFILDQVRKGNLIALSGGEPLLYAPLVVELGDLIRGAGGYVTVCSNGFDENRIRQIASHVNEIDISVKGSRDRIQGQTGIHAKISYDGPLRTISRGAGLPSRLGVFYIMFDYVKPRDLQEVIDVLPPNAFFVMKEVVPKTTLVHNDHSYTTILDESSAEWSRPPERAQTLRMFRELVQNNPQIRNKAAVIFGTSRDQTFVWPDKMIRIARTSNKLEDDIGFIGPLI